MDLKQAAFITAGTLAALLISALTTAAILHNLTP